jgi:hypothetical protein
VGGGLGELNGGGVGLGGGTRCLVVQLGGAVVVLPTWFRHPGAYRCVLHAL